MHDPAMNDREAKARAMRAQETHLPDGPTLTDREDRIGAALDRLEGRLDSLAARLAPVLADEGPVLLPPTDDETPARSTHAQRLAHFAAWLERLDSIVLHLTERVDL
jgi:hypothetical protein